MRMRVCAAVVLSALAGSALCTVSARAEGEGTFVAIPGRLDVPVIVNPYGYDASFTVVEGDFGLGQPVQVNPRIVGSPLMPPVLGPRRYYFPHTGRQPGYGRYEIAPPPWMRGPQTAQSYRRSWGAASDPLPALSDPPTPMTIQPFVGWGGGWRR
jgi:hypothetical protein